MHPFFAARLREASGAPATRNSPCTIKFYHEIPSGGNFIETAYYEAPSGRGEFFNNMYYETPPGKGKFFNRVYY